jgi:DNA-binding NarL/FixJ family response regulator
LTKIAESNAAKAIVVRLGMGVKTVESHRSQPMRKLDIRDTTSLVVVLHQEIPDVVLRL